MFSSIISKVEKVRQYTIALVHLDGYSFQLIMKEEYDNQLAEFEPKQLMYDPSVENSHSAPLRQQLYWRQIQYAMNVNESFRDLR